MTVLETPTNKDWPRRVAQAVNRLLRGSTGFERLDAEPNDPFEGQSYYDTTDHVARTWDGTAWMDHW